MKFSTNNLVPLLLMIWATQLFIGNLSVAFASNLYDVVINEIAWAGSVDNANDEWIELYNNTKNPIDLSGWYIEDDITTVYQISSATIPPKGFFLIEKNESAVLNLQSDLIASLSLANTGDSLVLKDSTGKIIDSVNSAGTMWASGSNTTKATMERINPETSGEESSNWNTATLTNGSVASLSSSILGTPKSTNSQTVSTGIEISLTPSSSTGQLNEVKNFSVDVNKAEELYAYGFEFIYDPTKLEFISSEEGNFLKKDGKNVSFMSSLVNATEGKLLIASSRLENPPTGVNGAGNLFSISFKIIADIDETTSIVFGSESFVSDVLGQQGAKYDNATITNPNASLSTVKNLKAVNGESVYSIKLTWDSPETGAEKYIIRRKSPSGSFEKLSETTEKTFTDQSNVSTNIDYEYRVYPVIAGMEGDFASVIAKETRGVVADIDKNKKVDGRDLEKLARSFGELFAQSNYNISADINYDGSIDGQDLILLGANFAKTY